MAFTAIRKRKSRIFERKEVQEYAKIYRSLNGCYLLFDEPICKKKPIYLYKSHNGSWFSSWNCDEKQANV